ncbi:thiazole biosynthesis adenylyltransferase ThiF [Bacillus alkalisoli]|uniref:thiazole biosynthesis adenylyltransferase ThiF n=1 Tax=Bacillus alkalisoli TaxID=2011008 RepID=UPI000C250070|nr:thiazole biosynthesis adenylyltransferase ThiF [Bacillus alkalisoli]
MERYSRQILFTPIGEQGQRNMREKHVLVIGAGALGTGNAEALVRAGIGKLSIVDRDYVEWSNLQRQQLYSEEDAEAKLPKAMAAKSRLAAINSEVIIEAHVLDATPDVMEQLADGVDLIIDATDNFDIRFIINDIAHKYNIPWIYGACVGSYGLSYTIIPGETPCLQCLLKAMPLGGATCDTVGIISPAVQMVVAHQVSEAMKLLTGDKDALRNKLVSFDLWKNQYVALNVSAMKSIDCHTCGETPTYPYLDFENQTKTAVLCGRDTVQIRPARAVQRNLEEVEKVLASQNVKVEQNPFLLSCELEGHRIVLFQDGRALVHGTKEIAKAKTLYHRYFGG